VGESGVTVIEWAERVADVLPRPILSVRIAVTGIDERRIAIGVVPARAAAQGEAASAEVTADLRALLASLRTDVDLESAEAESRP
jgi:hypothetical protein